MSHYAQRGSSVTAATPCARTESPAAAGGAGQHRVASRRRQEQRDHRRRVGREPPHGGALAAALCGVGHQRLGEGCSSVWAHAQAGSRSNYPQDHAKRNQKTLRSGARVAWLVHRVSARPWQPRRTPPRGNEPARRNTYMWLEIAETQKSRTLSVPSVPRARCKAGRLLRTTRIVALQLQPNHCHYGRW